MPQKRKLQVFVSSTYTDLKEERQAAVEAILTAGHIPAGMELFAAGDESQMVVIRRWIDESDVYLLLLGGRYGSIDPVSGKSYTHLEYEYALEKGKAMFAVVITDVHLDEKNNIVGKEVLELDNPQKLKDFKTLVTSRLVKFWNDKRDIQLAVLQTIAEFDRREELIGWIPGSEATNSGAIAEEIARLAKENAILTKENVELRDQLNSLNSSFNNSLYNGLTFDQVCKLLNQFVLSDYMVPEDITEILMPIVEAFGDEAPTLLHFFYQLKLRLNERQEVKNSPHSLQWAVHKLVEFNILYFINSNNQIFSITADGYQFSLRLQVEYNVEVNKSLLKKYQPRSTPWNVS